MKSTTPRVTSSPKKDAAPSEIFVNGVKCTPTTHLSYVANPKRKGCMAHGRYEKYSKARTVGGYFKKNATKYMMADLRHDHAHGFVEFTEA